MPCAQQIIDDAGAPRVPRRRRPTPTSQRLLDVLSGTAARRPARFERGIQKALQRILASPKFVFRVERDPAGVARRHGLPRQRSRARVAAVVLPVEQHSRRCSCSTLRAQGPAAHAGRARAAGARMLADPRAEALIDQLRRAVAVSAQPEEHAAELGSSSPTSTTTCGRRSSAKPSCSSRASCARTATCSI